MSAILDNTELLIQYNRKHSKLSQVTCLSDFFIYELNLQKVNIDKSNIAIPEDAVERESNAFTLESLKDVIGVISNNKKKGVKKPIAFVSKKPILFSDNLTVSMTEYVLYFAYSVRGIRAYISQGTHDKKNFEFFTYPDKPFYHNGFCLGQIESSFLSTSFILGWNALTEVNSNELEKRFFVKDLEFIEACSDLRYKAVIGKGPWDASIVISECEAFLQKSGVPETGINAVMDVVGELAPNAIEHGDTNCLVDVSCTEVEIYEDEQVKKAMNISLVIFDFSERLLGSALYEKIFNNDQLASYIHKQDRISTIRSAHEFHKERYSKDYSEEDFQNLIVFQKITGRKGDRADGGLGISTLIQRVQKYTNTNMNYCYVLSGNKALRLDAKYTGEDAEGYIGFNKERCFVNKIPDFDAVMGSKFYMPGVAYNLCFNFTEAG